MAENTEASTSPVTDDGPGRSRALLAAGDGAAVTGVLVAGELSHGISPLASPGRVAGTIAPFLVGWYVVAGLLGVYGDRARRPRESLGLTAGAWLGAANLGLIARNSPTMAGGTTWPFPLVVTGTVLVGLLAWRGAVLAYVGRGR